MPLVNIKFKLPDEQEEYDTTMKAGAMHCALHDIYQFLRTDSKYGEGKYEEVYIKFWEILKENDIDLFN